MTLPRTADEATESPAPRRSLGAWAARIGRFLAYSLLALLLGAIGFSLVLALLSAGVSTVVVWVGLPILVAGVLAARGFAAAERALQSSILGTRLPTPLPKQAPAGAGPVRRIDRKSVV